MKNKTNPTASVIDLVEPPKIDSELKGLIPPPTDDERARLKDKLRTEGCREKLVVALIDGKCVLLDGHTRYAICSELGIKPEYRVEPSVTDRDKAKAWIICHQLARRNDTAVTTSYLRGTLYNLTKGTQGGEQGANRQSVGLLVAEQHGVSKRTIERDGKFAGQLGTLVYEHGIDFRNAVLGPNPLVTKTEVGELAKLDDETAASIIDQVLAKAGSVKSLLHAQTAKPARPVPTTQPAPIVAPAVQHRLSARGPSPAPIPAAISPGLPARTVDAGNSGREKPKDEPRAVLEDIRGRVADLRDEFESGALAGLDALRRHVIKQYFDNVLSTFDSLEQALDVFADRASRKGRRGQAGQGTLPPAPPGLPAPTSI